MKTFLLISALALPFVVRAQTNSPAPAASAVPAPIFAAPSVPTNALPLTNSPALTNAAVRPPTDIFADRGDFDFKSRKAIYSGNVRVTDPQMNLTCDLLTVTVPEGGGRVNYIVAETNVVIHAVDEQGNPVHATANKAVYSYEATNSDTNEIFTLTGNPHVESQLGPSTGDPIIWNRTKNTVQAINVGMRIQQTGPRGRTNAPTPLPTGRK